MQYMIFFTGLASTPDTVGLKCLTTNDIVCVINCSRPTGKETREKFEKYKRILNSKYSNLVN